METFLKWPRSITFTKLFFIAAAVFFSGASSMVFGGTLPRDDRLLSLNTAYLEAQSPDEDASENIRYGDHFFMDLRVLGYGILQHPANSAQNPDNDLLQIPAYTASLDIRPDVRFDSQFLEISVKPRAKLDFNIWENGQREGDTDGQDDWWINEWLVRAKIREVLFVSYGRENLQWGPSFLYSPSNPFFSDNGRSNPYVEIPGMDFFRIVWDLHGQFSLSGIMNTDEGRNRILGPDGFSKTYAVKMDYTGRQNYASLILSKRESDSSRLVWGFFGGWTVSEAVLLYTEGRLTQGGEALYPLRDDSLIGLSMQKTHRDDADIRQVILAGGSYTLENAGTISLEYLYNGEGYSGTEADMFYELRRRAAALYRAGGLARLIGANVLSKTGNPGLRFLRKNYAMLQYNQTGISNRIDITLRWTQNIDDGSGEFLGLLSVSLGNHWEWFCSAVVHAGGHDTEYGTFLDHQVMMGLQFTF
jgi:hypothetical protein